MEQSLSCGGKPFEGSSDHLINLYTEINTL